jgi:uncharacterized protein (DUF488 family)
MTPRRASSASAGRVVYTIGHSTRPLEEFLDLLRAHGVTQLADVRTIPKSRRHPQFVGEAMAQSLPAAGIEYRHFPGLGGLRKASPDSPNRGWRHAGFRGYADYMQTPEFEAGLDALIRMSREKRTAIMCAEAVPWRCHRSLVADALEVRGVAAVEILSERSARLHELTPFARVAGTTVLYPAEQLDLL